MALFKAVKLEVLILCGPTETDENLTREVTEALYDRGAYEHVIVKVVKEHETFAAILDDAQA